MEVILQIFGALIFLSQAVGQEITTGPTMLYKNLGESVELPCQASRVSVSLSLKWTKKQNSTGPWVDVAFFGTKQGAFMGHERYIVNYQPSGNDGRTYSLRINGLRPEDAGQYRCQLQDQGSADDVIHKLFTLEDVQEVLVADNENMSPGIDKTFSYELKTQQGQTDGYFGCRVTSGFLKPSISVYITVEDRNHTITLPNYEPKLMLEGNERGLQVVKNVETHYTRNLLLKPEHDGQSIICLATLKDGSGQAKKTKQDSAKLSILYKPQFMVPRAYSAMDGDKNVVLAVEVYANPELRDVTWKNPRFEAKSPAGANGLETSRQLLAGSHRYLLKLTIATVTVDHINNWDLTACNTKGCSKQVVTFKAGQRDDFKTGELNGTGTVGDHAVQSSLPNIIVLVIPAVLAFMLQLLRH